ncbi:MAG TPA: hypothetical protein VMW83_01380 [Spirochaetia bacterium]|nr:hypothetical protein [Spirochaetia bacterium]
MSYKCLTIKQASINIEKGKYCRNEICQFMDDFRYEDNSKKYNLIDEEIVDIGDIKMSALLSAIVDYLCYESSVKVPKWVYYEKYFLKEPYFYPNMKGLRFIQLLGSPPPFLMRNIFTDGSIMKRV